MKECSFHVGVDVVLTRVDGRSYYRIVLFGLFVSGAMTLVFFRHRLNQAQGDSLYLIGLDRDDPLPPGAAGHGRVEPAASGH